MPQIPQSVAIRIPLLAFLSSDHITPATGKTIAVTISKNGAAFGNPSAGATNATEVGSGWYYVDLSTTDTSTTGPLLILGTAATIDNVNCPGYGVVNAHNAGFDGVPNATAAASGGLPTVGAGSGQITLAAGLVSANATQFAGQTITAAAGVTLPSSVASPTNITAGTITTTTNLTNAPTSGDFTAAMKTSLNAATPSVTVSDKTGFSLSSGGVQAIWDALTSALTTVGSIGKLLATNVDALISSRTKPADTQAAVTLVATTTNLTNAPTSGDFTAAMKTSLNAATPSVTVSDKTGFSLTAAYDAAKTAAQAGDQMALTAGTVAALVAAVWAAATRTLTSFGTLVSDTATAVWAAGARTLTAFGFTVTTDVSSLVTTNLNATVASRSVPGDAMTLTSAYDAAKTAAQAGDAMTLTGAYDAAKTAAQPGDIPTSAENADGLLARSLAGGSDGGRTVQDALRPLRNKVTSLSGVLTVYEENDTTTAWTAALTSDAAAEPIITMDPS